MPTRWKISLVLLILAGASAWLLDILLEQETGKPGLPRHDPDYFMENFSTITMEAEGIPKNKLFADYMAHYPDDNTIELVKPRLEIYQDEKLPMMVTAEKGWVTADNDVILLNGNVKLWQDNQSGVRELEVLSSEVKILTRQDYAESDKHTTIHYRKITASANGARAYFQENKLELLDNVHSTIIKNQPD